AVATPAEVTDDLKRLLEGFTVTVERNQLMSPATYLDEVRLSCEFQPGQGRIRADAIRAALTAQSQVRKDGHGVDNFGNERRVEPVERERFEAWMKRGGANIDRRPDGVYADHGVMRCWNSWWMSASFNTDTSFTTVPYALVEVVRAVRRFNECAEDGEDVDIGRDWFDALTTIGLLHRVQRSPARWEMTDAGRSLLDLASPSAGAVVPERWKLVPIEPTETMLEATRKNVASTLVSMSIRRVIYCGMLAAAPEVDRG
ncbi:hypothetical protein ACQKIE_19215, partial [Luteibacter sp. NPDC031894]|uniref:hypothetical protein n=1 Tax=Luteibacter sp. NPDC031894 TaxID=3390572 RepID=UPI003D03D49F